MKVVYVAPASPWPRNFGGSFRVAALYEVLSRFSDVRLFVVGTSPDDTQAPELERVGARVFPARAESSAARLVRVFSSLVSRRSIPAGRFFWPQRLEQLAGEIEREDPDLVILGETYLAELLLPLKSLRSLNCPIVIDTFNVESLLYRRVANVYTGLKRMAFSLLASNTAQLERRLFAQADAIWAASQTDASWYRSNMNLQRVALIPNTIELPEAEGLAEDPATVVYSGFFAYPPNDDAARRLVEISDSLQSDAVSHRMVLVGRGPSDSLLALASSRDQVVVTGEVDRVEPYVEKATVFAAPLAAGSGIKFKLLQAMGLARAIVTTEVGAEGLDLVDDVHALIREPQDFPEAIKELLDDPDRRARLGVAARLHVQEQFSFNALEAALRSAIDELGVAVETRG